MLKEICQKVNRLLVEVTYLHRRFDRFEAKRQENYNDAIKVDSIEELFIFNPLSTVEELNQFDEKIKNIDYFTKMVCLHISFNVYIIIWYFK